MNILQISFNPVSVTSLGLVLMLILIIVFFWIIFKQLKSYYQTKKFTELVKSMHENNVKSDGLIESFFKLKNEDFDKRIEKLENDFKNFKKNIPNTSNSITEITKN